ncbi:hypothetical protein [Streptomyces yangpuensis]|uniref:hypothetical protein n=1 Tax=Streptomyces yangpuensis TaxID=1648182 RepID=UPI00371138CE
MDSTVSSACSGRVPKTFAAGAERRTAYGCAVTDGLPSSSATGPDRSWTTSYRGAREKVRRNSSSAAAHSRTMAASGKETGADMKIKYKETARGGLAVDVIEC